MRTGQKPRDFAGREPRHNDTDAQSDATRDYATRRVRTGLRKKKTSPCTPQPCPSLPLPAPGAECVWRRCRRRRPVLLPRQCPSPRRPLYLVSNRPSRPSGRIRTSYCARRARTGQAAGRRSSAREALPASSPRVLPLTLSPSPSPPPLVLLPAGTRQGRLNRAPLAFYMIRTAINSV